MDEGRLLNINTTANQGDKIMTKRNDKMTVCGITYRFTVLERMDGSGPAFEATRYAAVTIGTDEDGDENRDTISRHATLAEAVAAAADAKHEFISNL